MLLSSLFCCTVQATEQAERIYLTQLVNQLDAMKPLIIAASKQQPKMDRVLFRYVAYRDANQTWHPGLLDQINHIQQSIQFKLDHALSEPALLPSMQGDYITSHKRTNP